MTVIAYFIIITILVCSFVINVSRFAQLSIITITILKLM